MVMTLGNFEMEGKTFLFVCFFNCCSMWYLAPRPGIKTRPPELEVQSLNH